jgi:choline-glycine betaine transporter
MRNIYKNIYLVLNKLFPVFLITMCICIYKEISDENKRIKERIETLTTLVSYKTSEIIEQMKDTTTSKK